MSYIPPREVFNYQDKETLNLVTLIYKSIQGAGKQAVLDRAIFKINPLDIEYSESHQRISEQLDHIVNEGFIEGPYDNDIARALVWSLTKSGKESAKSNRYAAPIIVKASDKTIAKNVMEHNVRSYGELLQYDPKKNGINYLKHGLFFCDVPSKSGDEFSSLITHSRINGEPRSVVFSRFKQDGVYKYIVSILLMSPPSEDITDTDFNRVASLVLGEFPEMFIDDGLTLKSTIDLQKISEFLSPFNDIRALIHTNQPMRFITSWIFDESNFESTVINRIKDNDLDADIIKQLQDGAVEILSERWNIKIKK